MKATLSCTHPSRTEEVGNPDHTGYARVYLVCEFCDDAIPTAEWSRIV